MIGTTPALGAAAALLLGAAAVSPASPVSVGSAALADPPKASAVRPLRPAIRAGEASSTGGGTARPSGSSQAPRAGWQWPLRPEPEVTRPFRRPASVWGSGHRGIDLAAAPGQPVLAAAAGRVTHVGVVAGRGTVSVLHTGGVRTTYEPVSPRVRRGDAVRSGEVIGVVDEAGRSHCTACLHVGALRGQTYLDPLVLLRPRRVVLLPLGVR